MRKSFLLASASIVALVVASAPVLALEQLDDTNDASIAALLAGNSARFAAPAAGTDEIFTIADGVNVGEAGVVVSAVTANNVGFLNFLGNSTATGSIGAVGNQLGRLDAGVGGTTVTFTGGAIFARNFFFSGAGTVAMNSDFTGTTIDFRNFGGTLNIAPGVTITATLSVGAGATANYLGAATQIGFVGAIAAIGLVTLGGDLVNTGGFRAGITTLNGNLLTTNVTYIVSAAGTINTTINSAATDDAGRVVAANTATVPADATVNVTTPAGVFLPGGTTYKIVDGAAAGGLVNVPGTITDDSAKVNFIGSTDGDDLTLTVVRVNPLGGGTGAGAALDDAASTGPSTDMTTVLNAFESLGTTSQTDAAVGQTAPEVNGGATAAGMSAANGFVGTVANQIQQTRAGVSYADRSGLATGNIAKCVNVWSQGFGAFADQGKRDGVDGYEALTYGVAAGADKCFFGGRVLVGAAYAYSRSDVDSKGARSGNTLDVESHQGAVYASYSDGPMFLRGMGAFGYNMYDSKRKIAFGAISRTANGEFGGRHYTGRIDGGYDIRLADPLALAPTGFVRYTHLDLDSYTETGAGALNLNVNDDEFNFLQIGVGPRLSYQIETQRGTLIPEVHALGIYEFFGEAQSTTATFQGGGGSFKTDGPDPAQYGANIGASLTFKSTANLHLSFNYDLEVRPDFLGHSGRLTVRYEF